MTVVILKLTQPGVEATGFGLERPPVRSRRSEQVRSVENSRWNS